MARKGVAKIINKDKGKVYVISSNDIDKHINNVFTNLKNGWHSNQELQRDYSNNPYAFTHKIISTTCRNEFELNEVRCNEIKKYRPHCYNKKCTTSHKGGNHNPFKKSGYNEDFIMTGFMEHLFNTLNESNLSQKNKDYLEDIIDDGLISTESQLKHAIDLFTIKENKQKPTYSSNPHNRQGQVLKFLSNKQHSLSDVDQLRNISVNDVMHWYKNSKNEGSVFSNFHIELKDSRPDIAEEIEMQIKNKNNNPEKTNSNINVFDSNNVNKKSITNNNVNKKVSKNKNNTKTPFTKTSWYKEVIKPLMAQLNRYDLDDVDRKILKRKINSYKIRNSKDLEIEYLKLIKYKNNGSNELLDENNEYDDSPIKKTNRYREELLNQLNQYNNLSDIKKNRLAKKINKGQIQTSWHLEEEVFGIQKKTKVKKQKHLNNHVPKQKQLDNTVAEQKHSNNKKNSFFNRILKLFHR